MVLQLRRAALAVAGISALVFLVGLALGRDGLWHPALVVTGFGVALGLGALARVASYQYTAWIVACVIAALTYPGGFDSWGGVQLAGGILMTTIIQLVMFGMATQMSISDFAGVVRHPRGLPVGLLGHYLVMPLGAFILVSITDLPAEIELGVILYGCVSSGLASNVMSMLAKANLGLAVTITAMSTIAAPLATPLLVQLLGGRVVDVDVVKMVFDVIQITLVPVTAALLVDYIKTAPRRARTIVHGAAVISAGWLVFMVAGGWSALTGNMSPHGVTAFKSLYQIAAAILIAEAYAAAVNRWPVVTRYMPYASMFGIMYYNTITTAAGRDALLDVGITLLIIGLVHNLTGYVFGYWGARGLGLDKASARATTFEVGLQNGGMATGLATGMGLLGTAGLAAAVFSPLGNVTGSMLANYWSRRPIDGPVDEPDPVDADEAERIEAVGAATTGIDAEARQ
ncbi:bile acid:sodium symporter family protein [Cryptosporangium sp. NPDC048952]|uniref:bile acid:sodium symporter family protein n=1 Tax=Cryptosporangium sp. NPDC048952 TaxID=3363961 RepID=UPI003711F892